MSGLIVLHGNPLPPAGTLPGNGFFLWGEGAFVGARQRPEHPRQVDPAALEVALKVAGLAVAATGPVRRGRLALTLPTLRARPVPSHAALREDEDYAGGEIALRPLEVEGLVLPPGRAFDALVAMGEAPDRPGLLLGDDVDYWVAVAAWALDLLHRRRVVPAVEGGAARWRPVLTDSHEKERAELFAQAMPPSSRSIGWPGVPTEGLYPAPSFLLRGVVDDLVDAAARDLLQEGLSDVRRRAGDGPEARALGLLAERRDGREDEAAAEPIPPEVADRFGAWSVPLLEALPEGDLRLGVRLLPPDPTSEESPSWRLGYHLEAADDPSLKLYAEEIWHETASSLRRLGRRFVNPQETLLARLGGVASLSPPIRRSLEERHPVGTALSLEEAWRFLASEAPLLKEAGVQLLLPAEGRTTKPSLRLNAAESRWKSGVAVTRFGLGTLVDFDWRVSVGDQLLTPDEFEQLANRKVPLVEVRGEWVLLDPQGVQRTLALFEKKPSGRTSLADFLKMASGLDEDDDEALGVDGITADGWLAELLQSESAQEAPFVTPADLRGRLRPYQEKGVSWLRFLLSRGLGSCLADDMGLGKTIQLLATLLTAREAGEPIRPSLLVCPTSVVENWVQEAHRFAPTLSVAVHHGPERAAGDDFFALVKRTDLLVTTYSLAHRDRALLTDVSWEYLALDEAQNIKNPGTAQSRAVRALRSTRRAALTGTPLENRLSELKAILDFLNPGLLGSDEAFRRTFSIPIERHHDPVARERLRRLTAPFLLRRTKTDPAIAPDLPDKIETKEWVGLTREQATLYRATTKALLEGIGKAQGQSRRAKVLLLLLRLKQICNHPALFLGDGSRLDGRSSKLTRLLAMLEETEAENRPALLFTQFSEMGHLLVRALRDKFDKEILFLHGGVPRLARAEMVRRFQEDDDPPLFFVLSLKAGGAGLNLTRASHVFHVDRWWNPAVEDQATDRAFRIGQTRHVQVHKFVCRGTLEERIDGMIDEKKELARSIIGAGESWITELSNEELAELVALSRDAVEAGEGA
jgi:SNF2 family DNA or RNA helicase